MSLVVEKEWTIEGIKGGRNLIIFYPYTFIFRLFFFLMLLIKMQKIPIKQEMKWFLLREDK